MCKAMTRAVGLLAATLMEDEAVPSYTPLYEQDKKSLRDLRVSWWISRKIQMST